jgi:hypothetical protein
VSDAAPQGILVAVFETQERFLECERTDVEASTADECLEARIDG